MQNGYCYHLLKRRKLLLSFARPHFRPYSKASDHRHLRILYCGSDEFSAISLRALNEYRTRSHQVQHIDVVCKAGKPTGRGLKHIRDVPLKSVAQELSLPCHEISTFTGWTPPMPPDLIIAVSFGLKVPARLLNGAAYGGLNLHPSLLPDLRGPAPLHHALLQGRQDTGVTLQTLHPDHFDQGAVVAQRGFKMPNQGNCTFKELYEHSARAAADLLIENLVNEEYLHRKLVADAAEPQNVTHAPKVTPEDSHVVWETWPSERVLRAQRALGHVWSHWKSRRDGKLVRVQWHGLRLVDRHGEAQPDHNVGQPFVVVNAPVGAKKDETSIKETLVGFLPTCDGRHLSCETLTIEGRPKHEAAAKGIRLLLDGAV